MKKILVVEDEPIILKFVSFRLEQAGYEILTASDGEKALRLIKENKPDLVLLDVLIPRLNGYEVTRQVKEDESLKQIYIILFTASDPFIVQEKIKEVMADGYIIKPFDADKLLETIKGFIG